MGVGVEKVLRRRNTLKQLPPATPGSMDEIVKELMRRLLDARVTVSIGSTRLTVASGRELVEQVLRDMLYDAVKEVVNEDIGSAIDLARQMVREKELIHCDKLLMKINDNRWVFHDIEYGDVSVYEVVRPLPDEIIPIVINERHRCGCGVFHYDNVAVVVGDDVRVVSARELTFSELLRRLVG